MTNLSSLQHPLGWGTPNVNHRNTPSPKATNKTLINCVTPKTERDGVYYWDPVEFLVEGCRFKVPRYQFIIGSSHFTEKFGLLKTAGVHYTGLPVILEAVSAAQFRVFLKFLFPIHTSSTTSYFTKDEWITILSLSTLWRFPSARELALEHLEAHLDDPFEQIIFGRAAYVPAWVSSGYTQLVSRSGCITEEESEWIGHRTTVRLYVLRHELHEGRMVRDDLPREIASRFSDELGALERSEMEQTVEKKHRKARGAQDTSRCETPESEDEETDEGGKREEEEWRRLREEQRRRAIEEENRRKQEEEERRLEKERKEEMRKRREEIEKRRKVEEEEQRKLREEEMRRAKEEERRRKEEEERIRLERERLEEDRKRKLEFEKKRRVEEEEGRKLRNEGRRRAEEEEKKRLEEEERRRLERERLEKAKRKRLEFEKRRKPEEEEARRLRDEGRRRAEEEERRREGETRRTLGARMSVNDDVRGIDRDSVRAPKSGEPEVNVQTLQEDRNQESEWERVNAQRMESRRGWARGLMETYFVWRGDEGE